VLAPTIVDRRLYHAEIAAYSPNEPAAVGWPAAKKVWASWFAEPTLRLSRKTDHAGVSGDLGFTAGTTKTAEGQRPEGIATGMATARAQPSRCPAFFVVDPPVVLQRRSIRGKAKRASC